VKARSYRRNKLSRIEPYGEPVGILGAENIRSDDFVCDLGFKDSSSKSIDHYNGMLYVELVTHTTL
jgi:hypothetical protein